MADTCCFCINLRVGTIIILLCYLSCFVITPPLSTMQWNKFEELKKLPEFRNNSLFKDGVVTNYSAISTDYVFSIYLAVFLFVMLLSAILRKSEILFYALIAFIIGYISLILYTSVGEENGCWARFFRFPSYGYDIGEESVTKSTSVPLTILNIIGRLIDGYFMYAVYSYVKQLRQGIPTSGQVIKAYSFNII